MKIVLDISGQENKAVQFYLDDLDICQCNKCEVFFGLDDLAVPTDNFAEDGFMCRQCLEASGKKEWWI